MNHRCERLHPLHPLHVSVLGVVALGGAAGALARAGLSTVFADPAHGFGWTTFAINVVGCFLLALLPAASTIRAHHYLPPLLGTGLLGGFTTLSTFSDQTRVLLAAGRVWLAATYVVGTLAAGLLAVALADRFSTLSAREEFDEEEGDL
ncbi:MAG TPA: CrcB family protein [Nocardioidaceae bacterium]|nr:CrcB family protein [Nocardioidaceae bacterium]